MGQEANIKSFLPEENRNGTTIKADEVTRQLVSSSETPISERLISQVGFNKRTGALNLVRHNGEIVSVPGFLTSAQLGEGPRGKKGLRGKDGKNGRLGRDGKKGKTGCQGPIGVMGLKGETGLDGEDGKIGNIGLYGCPGIPGPRGDQGPPGEKGDDGPQGPTGPDCLPGPRGETGVAPEESVYYGKTEPGSTFFLWAQPVETPQDAVIPEPEEMTGQVKDVSVTMSQVVDDTFGGNLSLFLKGFSGGKGPYKYKWTDKNNAFDEQGISVEGSTSSTVLKLKALRTIDPQQEYKYSGRVKLTITDSRNEKLVIDNIKFSFSGFNSREEDSEDPGTGGPVIIGGGGCLHEDTPILMWDGTVKKAKYVRVGETVQAFRCKGMLDESEKGWEDWKTTQLEDTEIVATRIKVSYKASYSKYWQINKDQCITDKHPLFVCKNQQWGWYDVDQIDVGDKLYGIEGIVDVESVDFFEEPINIVIIDAEPFDNYFAGKNPVLVHNMLDAQYKKH